MENALIIQTDMTEGFSIYLIQYYQLQKVFNFIEYYQLQKVFHFIQQYQLQKVFRFIQYCQLQKVFHIRVTDLNVFCSFSFT